jgi:hypothetical protein
MRVVNGWAVVPRNWDSTYWWAGVDLMEKITDVGVFFSREDARDSRTTGESVVKVVVTIERDGGY